MLNKIKQFICRPVIIKKKWKHAVLSLAMIGFFDTSYLTYSHYKAQILSCFGHTIVNSCQIVTESIYSTVLGVPVAVIGLCFYIFVLIVALLSLKEKYNFLLNLLLPLTGLAVLFSIRLTYLQIAVINYICYYCILSAAISSALLIVSYLIYKKMNRA
jgi:uncharacterized membrane protein